MRIRAKQISAAFSALILGAVAVGGAIILVAKTQNTQTVGAVIFMVFGAVLAMAVFGMWLQRRP